MEHGAMEGMWRVVECDPKWWTGEMTNDECPVMRLIYNILVVLGANAMPSACVIECECANANANVMK